MLRLKTNILHSSYSSSGLYPVLIGLDGGVGECGVHVELHLFLMIGSLNEL